MEVPPPFTEEPKSGARVDSITRLVIAFAALIAVVGNLPWRVHLQYLHTESKNNSFQKSSSYRWSEDCPDAETFWTFQRATTLHRPSCCCSITDYGAIGDNSTINTVAIQSAIDGCHERCDSEETVLVYVPPGRFQTGSILLRSNLWVHLAKGAAIYGSSEPFDYPIVPMMPDGYNTHKNQMYRSLLGGSHLQNVAITGENDGYASDAFATFSSQSHNGDGDENSVSVIDGLGWKWWCWYGSMPIPQDYCKAFNPDNHTLPKATMRPKLIEFYNSTNIVLDRFLARNSPVWFIHPFFSKSISMTNLTILAPREVGNTDGLDPDSCEDVLMDSCYIDVGDDGVSIKSTNHSGIMVPTKNVRMRNLRIVSRNWCIGSATFGGIYDILFEDSTIGDPNTVTSPWAIKFKSHRYFPGPMENITIRNIQMGQIGPTPWMFPKAAGSAFVIGLSYGESPPPLHPAGKPLLKNLTLENIQVASSRVAGQITGFPEDCLEGLTVRNVSVLGEEGPKWICRYVDLQSLTLGDISPPLSCTGDCNTTRCANRDFTNEVSESFL